MKKKDKRTVLIADDIDQNVFVLSALLNHKGYTSLNSSNGMEAYDKLIAHPEIDVILMDIMMPVMDGYEAMQRIRKNPQYDHIPIIAVSAVFTDEQINKCFEMGANYFVQKPIKFTELYVLMEKCFDEYKQIDRIAV